MSYFRDTNINIAGIGVICGIAVFTLASWISVGFGAALALAGLAALSVLVVRLYRRLQASIARQEKALAALHLDIEQRLTQASGASDESMQSVATRFADIDSLLEQTNRLAAAMAKRLNTSSKRLSGVEATLQMITSANKDIPPLDPAELTDNLTAAAVAAAEAVAGREQNTVRNLTSQLSAANERLRLMERDADTVRSGVIEAVQTGHFPPHFYTASSFNPEVAVLPTIAEFVEPKVAFDVGANRGEFTAALRHAGFAVHAFEPLPALNTHLTERFAADADKVRIHAVACSDSDGSAELHLATVDDNTIDASLFSTLNEHPGFNGFAFSNSITVPVRRLDTVFGDAAPMSIGLLKTDTEGNDISVLKGASTINAAVLMVEFWDKDYVFNVGTVGNSLQDYLAEIDRKKYPFWIVMWRGIARDNFGVAAGIEETPPGSWGNILFLSNPTLTDAVLAWARQTYGASRVKIVEKTA
ncbi:FkbM family methyltransferase [Bosea sp. (in: a-proteobacteria)]|jgi:FkbM family methyltransferase|uniref:FkbM family methyltransferase n=1 Tax=Bosea sp. (in: a-proteobacteria) TaxID=1871050 RepID=UPI003F70DBBD